jgi:ectoine hydroxylase-related dioxygenase (phytanoyl-CoA dioxygenase family)
MLVGVPFADRVEFGSSAWFATARDVLSALTAEVGVPAGNRVSVCEMYTGAPAHLGCLDNVVAWHARFADGGVTLQLGEVDDVDRKTIGDYHAVLPLKMAVFTDPDSERRIRRENEHRVGRDAIVSKGEIADPAVNEVLHRFHNKMARLTLDNEDLASRITGQGLVGKVAQLDEQGYTILENAISADFADELQEAIRRQVGSLTAEQNLLANGQSPRMLAKGRIFEEAVLHPWLLTIAEHMCGKLFNLHQSLGLARSTGGGLPLHDDYLLVREPFPPYCLEITSIWALQDFDIPAGPTAVVPGSHRNGHHPPNNYMGDIDAYPNKNLEMPKGSIAVWNGATWHAARTRQAAGERITLHNSFCRVFVRDTDRYTRNIDLAILERNPPILTTMTGHDSLYSMSTDTEIFYEGAMHNLDRVQS